MATQVLDGIPLSDLTLDHLNSLVTLRVEEDESLDFKEELKMSSSAEKRELCKDVSALSNTRGGLLFSVFGKETRVRTQSWEFLSPQRRKIGSLRF
jgi:hypothetical protein